MFFLSFFYCHIRKKSYFCSHKSNDSTVVESKISTQLNGGTVAQLVEQRTENPRVTGSIPVGTTLCRDAKSCVSFFCIWHENLEGKPYNKKSTS